MQPDSQGHAESLWSLSRIKAAEMFVSDGQPVLNRRNLLASIGVASVAALAAAGTTQPALKKSPLVPVELTCEHLIDPLGIDRPFPRLAWKFENRIGHDRGQSQTAWQIIVASDLDLLTPHQCDLWNSDKRMSWNSVDIAYAGKPLLSHQRCFWSVRAWDQRGAVSPWSKPAAWTMGVMNPEHWVAQWIGTKLVGANWKNYTLQVDLKLQTHASDVFFRVQPTGDGYLWQINTFGSVPVLKEHVRENGAYRVLKQVPLGKFVTNAEVAHWNTLKIVLQGNRIETYLNNHGVDVIDDNTFVVGSVGLREAVGEKGEFKNLTITGPNDQILLNAPLNNHRVNPFLKGRPGPTGLELAGSKAFLGGILRTPMLRREIVLKKSVKRAWIYASALGIYELSINGRPVSRQLFAPGDTNYYNRIDYQMYDATHLLQSGENVIGAMLAPGWYCGHIGWFGKNLFGSIPALFAQLHVEYHDSTMEVVATDSTWKVSPSPVVYADNLMGETYDARLEQPGWNRPNFNMGKNWVRASLIPGSHEYTRRLASQMEQPVRAVEKFSCKKITEPKPGVHIADLGQLITGVCRLKVRGPAGTKVTLRYGEGLNPDGTLFTGNLRAAKATDHYILKGLGVEVFQPRFTFHGFRYIEVTGYPGKISPSHISGILTVNDLAITGEFHTNQPLINKIQSCIFWTGRDTQFSIPIAVPDRNERLGWAGDINFFSRTAVFNFDLQAFYANWLGDFNRDQVANGIFGNVAPLWMPHGGGYGGGWGDVGICLPYLLYEFYADRDIVRRCWPFMEKNIRYMKTLSRGRILPGSFAPAADWLNVNQPTPPELIATAFFAYDALLMSRMATGIGKDAEAAEFKALFENIALAFRHTFVKADGTVGNNSQTGYVMALFIGLVPRHLRQSAAAMLVANIAARGGHLATGFVGSQWLLDVLTRTGHHPLACQLIQGQSYPSWGYEATRGSTTFWESWNAVTKNGVVFAPSPDPMANPNSLCAPPLAGSVGDWMYRNIAGIAPDFRQPGFEHILIHPRPGGKFISVSAGIKSIRGFIKADWRINGRLFFLNLQIPPNTWATAILPAKDPHHITESGKPLSHCPAVKLKAQTAGAVALNIKSGIYQFQVKHVDVY